MSKPQHVPVLLEAEFGVPQSAAGDTWGRNYRRRDSRARWTLLRDREDDSVRTGKLICFDRDPEAMAKAKVRLEEVAAEIGSEMPQVIYEPRAFSEAAEAIASRAASMACLPTSA